MMTNAKPIAATVDTHAMQDELVRDIDAVLEEPRVPDTSPSMFVWHIPSDREEGYELPIEVPGVDTIEEARRVALEGEIPYVTLTGETLTRPLSRYERMWVEGNEPDIRRDTQDVAFEHNAALSELDTRKARDAEYAEARRLLGVYTNEAGFEALTTGSLGEAVAALIGNTQLTAQTAIQQAEELQAARVRALSNGLQLLQFSLAELIESTGFAPPKPEAPREPSSAGVVVHVPQGYADAALLAERLPNALLTTRDLSASLDEAERMGLSMLARFGEDYGREKPMSTAEAEAWDAIMRRVVGTFG